MKKHQESSWTTGRELRSSGPGRPNCPNLDWLQQQPGGLGKRTNLLNPEGISANDDTSSFSQE
jgi:hypothetical protein